MWSFGWVRKGDKSFNKILRFHQGKVDPFWGRFSVLRPSSSNLGWTGWNQIPKTWRTKNGEWSRRVVFVENLCRICCGIRGFWAKKRVWPVTWPYKTNETPIPWYICGRLVCKYTRQYSWIYTDAMGMAEFFDGILFGEWLAVLRLGPPSDGTQCWVSFHSWTLKHVNEWLATRFMRGNPNLYPP